MKSPAEPQRPGRPRAFDPDVALEKAMHVFWEKGFQGASLTDLTRAMGINRPSLYAAYGNKEALFCKVMDRYGSGPSSHIGKALEAPTAREVAERILRGTAELLGDPNHPPGCLGVNGIVVGGKHEEGVCQEMAERRRRMVEAIKERFARAKKQGDLPKSADPHSLALFLAAVAMGMSVQSANGVSRKELVRVAETAMRAWPS